MAKIYYRRIVAGQITLADVPDRYNEQVKIMLENDGIN